MAEKEIVMNGAGIEEIGFIVRHIDDNGFIRILPLGGFDPKTLTAQRVIVHGTKDLPGCMGVKPIHVMSPEERTKMPAVTDYVVDVGLPKEEVEKYVSLGDSMHALEQLVEAAGGVVCGRATILAEGKAADRKDLVYLEKLPLFTKDGKPLA